MSEAVLSKTGDTNLDGLLERMSSRFRQLGYIEAEDSITSGYILDERNKKNWFLAHVGPNHPLPEKINDLGTINIIWIGIKQEQYQLVKAFNDVVTNISSFFWQLDRGLNADKQKIISIYYLAHTPFWVRR
jgi:hypothetical protein